VSNTLLWLPEAEHDIHNGHINPWTTTSNPKGCLHTTEGDGWPDYQGWTIMPHATVLPHARRGVVVRQHIPFSSGSFALKNEPGGVQTNRAYVFQFELIGTCSASGPGYFWPNADDAVLLDLWRKVIGPLSLAFAIPMRAPKFLPYYATGAGGSYGERNGVRLTGSQWMAFTGWLGHQHAPENNHGDPGAFPFGRLVKLAAGDTPHPPKPPVPKPRPHDPTHPAFPLPAGWYFGPKSGPDVSVSGHYSHRDDLRRWQAQMHWRGWEITADGLYGKQTHDVAAQFQHEKALHVDGLIGKATWDAAWTTRVSESRLTIG
jgi:peptidoglycan hydrolase-like protein with peptidoglycan-binding domain